MLATNRQYVVSNRQLSRWKALKSRVVTMTRNFSLDDEELISVMDQRIDQLSENLKCFEDLTRASFDDLDVLRSASRLPEALINARIALKWTRHDLAVQVGLVRQNLYRYEKQSYRSISLSKVIQIASVLDESLSREIDTRPR